MPNDPVRGSVADSGETATTGVEPFRLGYRPELDGLRALAIALVFVAHIGYPWQSLMGNFMPGSFQGVDLFFVLSGFLLTKLVLEERAGTGGFSFKGFYRRRALRLLPPLFFMLLVLIPWTIQQHESGSEFFIAEAFVAGYVANWAVVFGHPGIIPFNLSHMWSLAIEEQYYVVFFPLLIGLLGLFKSIRKVTWVLVGLIAVVWVDRIFSALHTSPGTFETTLYVRTDIRADALLIGPLVAIWLQTGHRITPRIRLLGIPAAAFLVWTILYAHVEDRWVYIWAIGLIDIAWAFVLIAVLGGTHPITRVLQLRPIIWIGTISYGLYLWHMPIFVETMRHTRYRDLPHWLPFAIAVALTFIVATLSFYVIERPFLRRKRPR
ncbi:MAG: acyltransferase [Actinobacteria bacterium]|nr:acyltransferase [Actinomycetota bacterium]